jgi:protein phosphatase
MPTSTFLTAAEASILFDPIGGTRGLRVVDVARDACAKALRAASDLPAALEAANAQARLMPLDEALLLGGACSAVGVAIEGDVATIAWVGDAAAFRVRNGAVVQLTRPHLLADEYERVAMLDADAPPPDVLVRALGMRDAAEVEVRREPVVAGDLFVLASVGVGAALGADLEPCLREAVQRSGGATRLLARDVLTRAWARSGRETLTVVAMGTAGGEPSEPAGASFPAPE